MTRPVCRVTIACCIALSLFFPAASDDEGMERETGVTLLPRAWVALVDPLAGPVVKKEASILPTYGLTLVINPKNLPNHAFLLSAQIGEGDGDVLVPGFSLASTLVIPPFTIDVPTNLPSPAPATIPVLVDLTDATVTAEQTTGFGETDIERVDLEFLVRQSFPGKWYSVFYGARYVRWSEESVADARVLFSLEDVSGTVGGVAVALGDIERESDLDLNVDFEATLYGVEGGLGILAEMTDDGRHRLFSNLILALGYTDWTSSGAVLVDGVPAGIATDFVNQAGSDVNGAFDGNFGYQYAAERYSLHVRYRAFVLVQENALRQTQFTTLHGPEFGVSFRF